MDSKPLKALVTVVAVLAGLYVSRHAMDWLRKEPGVSAEALTKPWSLQSVGAGELRFEAPWPLDPGSMDLPAAVRQNVESTEALSMEKDGLHVLAARIKARPGVALSLDGAADGMTGNLRNVPGTLSVDASKHPATLSGSPAYDIVATVKREKAEPLTLHGFVTVRGQSIYELILICRSDQPNGEEVWKRMRNSLELRF